MGKFTVGSNVQQDPNQIEELKQRIQADLPAGEAQPTPSPQQGEAPGGSLLSQIVNSPVPQDIPGAETAPTCLLYTSPSPRDRQKSRMPSSA